MPVVGVRINDTQYNVNVPEGLSEEEQNAVATQKAQNYINDQQIADRPMHERIAGETVGAVETAGAVASMLPIEAASGLAGAAALPFKGVDGAIDTINSTQDYLNNLMFSGIQPETARNLRSIAEHPLIQKVGDIDEWLKGSLGEAGYEVGGPVGGAIGEALPALAESVTGLKIGKTVSSAAPDVLRHAADSTVDSVQTIANNATKKRREVNKALDSDFENDVLSFGYEKKNGWLAPHAAEQTAIKAEIPDTSIAASRSAGTADLREIRRMVGIAERGFRSPEAGILHRPGDVVGETIAVRAAQVLRDNRKAGEDIDRIANSPAFKSIQVDVSGPVNGFLDDLRRAGVEVDDLGNLPKDAFKGSEFSGLSGIESTIATVLSQLQGANNTSALSVHRMKRILDKNISYGKDVRGLDASTEGMIRKLRRGLDDVLDQQFSAYDNANTRYATTIHALDELQSVAGKRVNLTEDTKQLGTLSRRVMSNAASREALIKALNQLDEAAFSPRSTSKDLVLGGAPVRSPEIDTPRSSQASLTRLASVAVDLELSIGDKNKTSFRGILKELSESVPTVSPTGAAVKAVAKHTVGKLGPDERTKKLRKQIEKIDAYKGLFGIKQ